MQYLVCLFQSGKIAAHLDLVSHQIRERLDEIKRQEINRLRMLAKEKMKQMNGMDVLDSIALFGGMIMKTRVVSRQELFPLLLSQMEVNHISRI